jgi:hypothetical protein
MVTKVNKSAEIMFNSTSSVAVGTQIAEFLGIQNNHFLGVINSLTSKPKPAEKKDEGQIGGEPENEVLLPQNLSQELLGTYLITPLGKLLKDDNK